MRFHQARLAFLPSLLLFQLAGDAQAIPVRNDETELRAKIEATAESGEMLELAEQVIPALVPAAPSNRLASEGPAKVLRASSAPRAGESSANENFPSLASGVGPTQTEPDPLGRTLRSIVNVTRRQDASPISPRPSPADSQFEIDFGDEGRAAIREARGLLADTIQTALDPRADEDGRITFSIAGIEGFHLLADGDSLSLGLGDSILTTIQRNREGENGSHSATRLAGFQADGYPRYKNRLPEQEHPAVNPIAEALALAKEVIEHPMTWVFVALYFAFKIASAIRSMRLATRRHAPAGHRRKRAQAT